MWVIMSYIIVIIYGFTKGFLKELMKSQFAAFLFPNYCSMNGTWKKE